MSPCSTRRPGGWTSRAGSRSPTTAARPTSTPTPCSSPARSARASDSYRGRGRAAAPIRQAGHRDRGPRAARRFLSLSAARADHDRQPPDQAGQLPRRRTARRPRAPMNIATAGSAPPSSRRAPTPCCASRRSRDQGLGDALPGRHGPGLSARRARQSAIRRRERDRPHADGLRARPHHRPGVRRQGPAGGRAARADQSTSRWRTTMRYTLDQRARPSRSPST